MALYKILTCCAKGETTLTGEISGNVTVSGCIESTITDKIKGEISGYIYGVNYVASNMQQYSGVASGVVSGEIEGTISGVISGWITEMKQIQGTIKKPYIIPGLSFLRDDREEDIDWSTTTISALKEKLLYLYNQYPTSQFIPVHVMNEELSLELDECKQ